ncbi:MAG: hypothetical protein AAGB51_11530 [Planctomycetota bacterium]
MVLKMARLAFCAACLAAAMSMVGCGSSSATGKYNVEVALGPGMVDPESGAVSSLEVDLVGVNETESARWTSYPLSQYFSGADQLRNDASKVTLAFTTDESGTKILARNDEIWEDWRGRNADQLFVLVNLLGVDQDLPGDQDPRRLILPLSKNRWSGNTLEIEIRPSRVVCQTPLKPVD